MGQENDQIPPRTLNLSFFNLLSAFTQEKRSVEKKWNDK